MEQTRDFWIVPNVRWSEGEPYHFDGYLADRVGADLATELVQFVRGNPAAWVDLVLPVLRENMWWIRNRRWSGRSSTQGEIGRFFDCMELAAWAGIAARDMEMLLRCLMARCVCDGCDLSSGQRWLAGGIRAGPKDLPASEVLRFGKLSH